MTQRGLVVQELRRPAVAAERTWTVSVLGWREEEVLRVDLAVE